MLIGYYYDVEATVYSREVERHNLNLAQVLISSPRLAYSDGKKIYRGILDWDKVENQLVKGSELLSEIGYPNSLMAIGIRNLGTGDSKAVGALGPISILDSPIANAILCLGPPKFSLDMIFRIPPLSLWYPSDIARCVPNEIGKYGTEIRSFPISIIKNNVVYSGVLKVSIMEMW
jgi:hypothetical protein